MGLFRILMMLSFKTLLVVYFLGTNCVTVADKSIISAKLRTSITAHDGGDNANPPSPPPPPPQGRSNAAPFKPSVAVVVAVLTTIFSVTFLLLLYAKHCKRGNGYYSNNSRGRVPPSSVDRKNSGVDRTVIESLPVFRFGSLRGSKDGLECAVCLNRFEPTEVLKLLPKCKHAFHVECVDTWLDAHSTCPLCRYRVDPEDILLLTDDAKFLGHNEPLPPQPPPPLESLRRVSGRHSSAGERGNSGDFLEILLEKPGENKNNNAVENGGTLLTTRRSVDGWSFKNKKKKTKEAADVGRFDRRKDGMLLPSVEERTSSDRRRLEHRIIVDSGGGNGAGGSRGGGRPGFQHRWSDVQPSDLLYLRSENVMSDSRRLWGTTASGSRPSESRQDINNHNVINGRSVSEITGLSRLSNNYGGNNPHNRRQWRCEERGGEREAGVVSRWLAWVSQSPYSSSHHQSQSQETVPDVRS